jgi:hypothetical protein
MCPSKLRSGMFEGWKHEWTTGQDLAGNSKIYLSWKYYELKT